MNFKQLKNVGRIVDLLELGNITIVSYGLAPNPNGFYYERGDDTPSEYEAELQVLLDNLNEKEIEMLKQLMGFRR